MAQNRFQTTEYFAIFTDLFFFSHWILLSKCRSRTCGINMAWLCIFCKVRVKPSKQAYDVVTTLYWQVCDVVTSYICQEYVILTSCARWVLILYQSRADQTDQSCLLHTSVHEFQKIISIILWLWSDCAHADPRSHHPLIRNGYQCLRYTAETLKLQESKKQRFATLTNDEYATLSTLLHERESNNTRRAADMAVRTFVQWGNFCCCYIIKQLLIMAALNMMSYSPENINIDFGCRLGQYWYSLVNIAS